MINAPLNIIDLSGRTVKQYTFNTTASAVNTIDASDLSNGVYLIQLNNKWRSKHIPFY